MLFLIPSYLWFQKVMSYFDEILVALTWIGHVVSKMGKMSWMVFCFFVAAVLSYMEIGGKLLYNIVSMIQEFNTTGTITSMSGVPGVATMYGQNWLIQIMAQINYIYPLEETVDCFMAWFFVELFFFTALGMNWVYEKIRG